MLIDSAQELAHAVREGLPNKHDLAPLPWRRHEPRTTLWWLTPSHRNPAYADAKLAFSLDMDSPRQPLLGIKDGLLETGTIFVGLNVERGFGTGAYAVGPPKPGPEELLGPAWIWYQVVEGDGPTQFARTLALLSREVTTHLYVASSTGRDSDDTKQHRPVDAVVYSCKPAGIEKILDNGFPDGVLKQDAVENARRFEDLAAGLRQVDDFHWVDIYAGTYVARGEIDLGWLDEKVLSFLDPWVRSGYPAAGRGTKAVRV